MSIFNEDYINTYNREWKPKSQERFCKQYGSSQGSLSKYLSHTKLILSAEIALEKFYLTPVTVSDQSVATTTVKESKTPVEKKPKKPKKPKKELTEEELRKQRLVAQYKNIRTVTTDKDGGLIFNQALLKTKPGSLTAIESELEPFRKTIFYERILSIMNDPRTTRGLEFSMKPLTGHSVYCALVKVQDEKKQSKIQAYVGKTGGEVRSRWNQHVNHIAARKAFGENASVKYQVMSTVKPKDIIVFYLTDKLTEDECAQIICGEDYVSNPLCLNRRKCSKALPSD